MNFATPVLGDCNAAATVAAHGAEELLERTLVMFVDEEDFLFLEWNRSSASNGVIDAHGAE